MTNTNNLTRSQGRKKSKFSANSDIPAGATFDFVANGANYKITVENLLLALNLVGSLAQDGDPLGVPILDTQGTVHNIRNLDVVANSGLAVAVTALNGISIQLDAQTTGTGVDVLNSTNKIRKIKAGTGITVTLSGDDIVIALA